MSTVLIAEPIEETSPVFRASIYYLLSILAGAAAAIVRFRLVVPADAAATATNILTHEPLFRLILAADLLSAVCYVAVTLVLYDVLKTVSRRLALLTVLFSFVSCAITAFACLLHIVALVILRGAQYLHIAAVQPLPQLALLFLRFRAEAYSISLVFFALSCLLIGYLLFKCGILRMPAALRS